MITESNYLAMSESDVDMSSESEYGEEAYSDSEFKVEQGEARSQPITVIVQVPQDRHTLVMHENALTSSSPTPSTETVAYRWETSDTESDLEPE